MAQNMTVLGNQADYSEQAIDVKSVAVTATIVNGACRLRSISQTSAGTAGTIIWRDGGPGGAVLFTTYSAVNSQNNIKFPFPGKTFANDVHVTFANVTGLVISYH
jgi:hypothetical protein